MAATPWSSWANHWDTNMRKFLTTVFAACCAAMVGILLTGCTQQQERHYDKSSDDYAALYAKITVNVFVDAKRCFAMLCLRLD